MQRLATKGARRLFVICSLLALATCLSTVSWATDANWARYETKPALEPEALDIKSFYLTMRDGVRIAVTTYLPKDLPPDVRLPTVMLATRYFRAYKGAEPGIWERRWVANGYAHVRVDSRGTGASEGSWPGPWGPEEVKDYGEVLDWIAQQPWSDGQVATNGVSYDGTTAEMAATTLNPALKAAVPDFSLFDAFTDVAFPGGIFMSDFSKKWSEVNAMLDRNGPTLALASRSILPVDEDSEGFVLKEILQRRRHNGNVYLNAKQITFRDDPWQAAPDVSQEMISPHGHIQQLIQSGIPFYGFSGWFDGGYADSAVKRFLNVTTPGSRMTLGPWSHGGGYDCSPDVQASAQFDRFAEICRFLDHHLKGLDTGIADDRPVHYYTMIEGRWKSADQWPPQATTTNYYFAGSGRLTTAAPQASDAVETYSVDYATATGGKSWWDTLLGGPMATYSDRAREDQKLLCFTTEPLEADVEVTGHPQVILHVELDQTDGQFFAYLEDVAPDGTVHYVTEGQLRGLHRNVKDDREAAYVQVGPFHSFLREDGEPLTPGEVETLNIRLQPVSYLFRAGHSLRIALAGADSDHFAPPETPPAEWEVQRTTQHASCVVLPIVARSGD